MEPTETDYLTVPEVAQRLGMTPDGAYKLIQKGKIGAVRLSERKLRVPVAAFDRYTVELQHRIKRDSANPKLASADVLGKTSSPRSGRRPKRGWTLGSTTRSKRPWRTSRFSYARPLPGRRPSLSSPDRRDRRAPRNASAPVEHSAYRMTRARKLGATRLSERKTHVVTVAIAGSSAASSQM